MPPRTTEREKITVSLPPELIRYANRRAAERGLTRSEVIGEAVAGLRAQDEEELAGEGYRFYAEEAAEFAASSLGAVSDAIEHS